MILTFSFRQAKQFDEIKQAIVARGHIHGFHVEEPEAFEPEDIDYLTCEDGLREFL